MRPVVHEVRIVARVRTVLTEVVGVNRPEERIVGVLVFCPLRYQRLETSPGRRWGQLKRLRWHVTVCARASVAAETVELTVAKCLSTMRDCVAGLSAAVELRLADALRDD
jgi:hypothetical protein